MTFHIHLRTAFLNNTDRKTFPIKYTTKLTPAEQATQPPPEPLPSCPEDQVLNEESGLCVPTESPEAEEAEQPDLALLQRINEKQIVGVTRPIRITEVSGS